MAMKANTNWKGAAAGNKWIAAAIGKPGALHAQLGIPRSKKIPQSTLFAATKAPGVLGKRARLAKTLEGLNK